MERRIDGEKLKKGYIDKAETKGRKRQTLEDGVSYRKDTS